MSSLHFRIVAGPDAGKSIPLTEGTGQVLGRSQDAKYRLDDPRVSRMHCEVRVASGRVTVHDNGSAGGTFVNGSKIEEVALKVGDQIQIGDTTLRLEGADASTISPKADHDPQAIAELSGLSGRSLAHFAVGEVVGQSDTGMIFRAVNQNDNQTVALKVMPPAFSQDDEEMQRFVRAMKTVLPLDHPNLVRLYAAGKNGPYCWMAMEFVEGESLTKVIQRIGVAGMLEWKHAFRVGVHVARGLDYAHGHGIVHRNIMPANILIRSSDKLVKLGDLMLAKALEGAMAKQVTRPGEMLGDINYMSPERTKGETEALDARSDLFSLGATLYALLTGKPPFAGTGMVDTIQKIRTAEPAKPSTSAMGIPSSFEGVVLKLLAKDPGGRYQTAREVVTELERVGTFSGVKM